ncbi:MAG TPA: beta-ketoacyl-[acyl-carrier-protein] synthase family protein [Chitinophagaceae bacterium]|nr:beta-ketoacyl-[acyl-carrier-protein] synthase family protein [Chitinophagaceae bacterium]
MQGRRVVVTGMGIISALGNSVDEVWDNVLHGRSGIGPLKSLEHTLLPLKIASAAEVKNYTPAEHFEKKDLDMLDRFAQFCLYSAREAVKQSGIEFTPELGARTAVITGTSIGGENTHDKTLSDLYLEKKGRAHPFSIPMIMPNAGASQVSMAYGLTGPAYTVTTACASSNHALGNAFWLVRNGLCDVALTGGSETPITYGYLKAWEAIRVVAPDTCRPFSKNRQGMILGEGGAMMVIETLEHAKARGAKILAEITGFGMTSDASHITKPSQTGAEHAMINALKDAGLQPSDIDYINAHGTGTMVNDSMEIAAIKNVFGDHAQQLAVSSTKSLHGHVLGGTSALEAVITTLAVHHDILPPTANYQEFDPECDLDIVPNESRSKPINHALSNSFAFGGLNAVVVFSKYRDTE